MHSIFYVYSASIFEIGFEYDRAMGKPYLYISSYKPLEL